MSVLEEFGLRPHPFGGGFYSWTASRHARACSFLTPAWFDRLTAGTLTCGGRWRDYDSREVAERDAISAWDSLPEHDKAALRVVFSGRAFAASV